MKNAKISEIIFESLGKKVADIRDILYYEVPYVVPIKCYETRRKSSSYWEIEDEGIYDGLKIRYHLF